MGTMHESTVPLETAPTTEKGATLQVARVCVARTRAGQLRRPQRERHEESRLSRMTYPEEVRSRSSLVNVNRLVLFCQDHGSL